jgi:hypothetical protein
MSASAVAPAGQDRLARTSREALGAMGVQYLLGIGTNLIGPPDENSSVGVIAGGIVGALHVLVGVGLIVVGVRVLRAARGQGVGGRAALWALAITIVTFLCGVGTVLVGSEWLSFLMAVGWLAGAALYLGTLVLGLRAAPAVDRSESTA